MALLLYENSGGKVGTINYKQTYLKVFSYYWYSWSWQQLPGHSLDSTLTMAKYAGDYCFKSLSKKLFISEKQITDIIQYKSDQSSL